MYVLIAWALLGPQRVLLPQGQPSGSQPSSSGNGKEAAAEALAAGAPITFVTRCEGTRPPQGGARPQRDGGEGARPGRACGTPARQLESRMATEELCFDEGDRSIFPPQQHMKELSQHMTSYAWSYLIEKAGESSNNCFQSAQR